MVHTCSEEINVLVESTYMTQCHITQHLLKLNAIPEHLLVSNYSARSLVKALVIIAKGQYYNIALTNKTLFHQGMLTPAVGK